MKREPCQNCGNVETLYRRKSLDVCLNCATLNPRLSRVRPDDVNYLDPINQPLAINGSSHNSRGPCVRCGVNSRSVYRWREGTIRACGWGCAGYWMDGQMEVEAAKEAEEYVRRSLGMESR